MTARSRMFSVLTLSTAISAVLCGQAYASSHAEALFLESRSKVGVWQMPCRTALRVMMGALCHPIAVDLDSSGIAGDSGDNLGLCAPADAPVGNAPFTDGAPQNAGQFDNVFPYLTTPLAGS